MMEMSTVVVTSGKFSDLLRIAETGSVIFLGEVPHKSWNVDLDGNVYVMEQEGSVAKFGERGELILQGSVHAELGREYVIGGGKLVQRRGMKFYLTTGGNQSQPLGLFECDSWRHCKDGIAYVSGDKFFILVIRDE